MQFSKQDSTVVNMHHLVKSEDGNSHNLRSYVSLYLRKCCLRHDDPLMASSKVVYQ